eukprot:SAG31_NODE_1078_length_10032_cov_4.602034_2_plen_199_part_00
MACFHIPKTIDNDLRVTDHCPGFASAARFVAHAFQGDDRDLRAMGGCKINICMGRDAGWLTAASTLGRRPGSDDGPHLVYLPEVPLPARLPRSAAQRDLDVRRHCVANLLLRWQAAFDEEEFVAAVQAQMEASAAAGGKARCLVAVSEGIRGADGTLFLEAAVKKGGGSGLTKDSHGVSASAFPVLSPMSATLHVHSS